jgi:hypothetical protein
MMGHFNRVLTAGLKATAQYPLRKASDAPALRPLTVQMCDEIVQLWLNTGEGLT